MREPLKLYTHRVTIQYYDYKDYVCSETRLAWSYTGKAQDTHGSEWCEDYDAYRAKKAAKLEEAGNNGRILLLEGEPVTRKSNMNPHGLM